MGIILFLLLIIEILGDDKIDFGVNITKEKEINKNYFINDTKNRKRKLAEYEPIRIFIDKGYLRRTILEDDIYNIFDRALDRAKNTLEKLIKVKPETSIDLSQINLEDYGFYKTAIDTDLMANNNLQADLAIFVRGPRTNEINKCKEKQEILIPKNYDGRPTIGYMVINTGLLENIENNSTYQEELFSYMFLHQITHILGFSKSVLEKRNQYITIKNEIINRIDISDAQKNFTKKVISGENIRRIIKNYFKCDKITGIELEDYISSECGENYHWESRILFGDYMTGLINSQEQVISEFTLALLEDTQYYQVNYFTGGLMRFGMNQNCSFFEKDCNSVRDIQSGSEVKIRDPVFINEFCSEVKATCSSSRQSRGICDAFRRYSGDYSRQYWAPNGYGNYFADYCPVSLNQEEYQDDDHTDDIKYSLIGNCKYGSKNFGKRSFLNWDTSKNYNFTIFSDSYGEVYSNTSFCAFSSAIHKNESQVKKDIYEGFIRPTCYEMYCSNRSLTILINTQYVVCPRRGGYVGVSGNYTGHVLCPDYNLICSQTKRCNNMFDCAEIGSERKPPNYDYIPFNNSIQLLKIYTNDEFDKSYELSNLSDDEDKDRKCPFNCSECNLYSQCFVCAPGNVYVGKKENDQNPIKCYPSKPTEGSYYNTSIDDKLHYFECIEHCKECSKKDECDVCEADYKLSNKKCIERIKGCQEYDESSLKPSKEDNGGGPGYELCDKCNKTNNYYCLNTNKSYCENISKTEIEFYYDLDNSCVNKCESTFPNCSKCNKDHCTECKDTHYLNYKNKCLENITNCRIHNTSSDTPECDECIEDHACLGVDKTKCNYIHNISIYYHKENKCVEKCSDHIEHCWNCTIDECYNCDYHYFPHPNTKKECVESIDHCLVHDFDSDDKICKQCEPNYYCVESNNTYCEYIEQTKIIYYYNLTNNPYSCVKHCGKQYANCLTCDSDKCIKCKNEEYYEWNEFDKKCKLKPEVQFINSCSLEMREANTVLKEIDLFDFANAWDHIPYIGAVDHYVNKDYTVTVFINSGCTEELLKQGYFKIDSNELQESIKTEFTNYNYKIIFGVFVTHNFKSHFRYYDEDLKLVDTTQNCNSCKNKEYTITNNYIKNVDRALGPLVAGIVESEKINIFERDSNVYNSICQNITLLSIDMPLKKRLSLLYPHDFSEQMACLGGKDICVIEEFNLDESTCTCKCKMGNKFEELLNEVFFTHYEGESIEVNDFVDSIGIIKCLGNGFVSKNLKANGGFFICIIVIVGQIVLYVYYLLCSTPLINLPKSQLKGNPPKKNIILFSDWNKILSSKNVPEGEIYIQPRDDAEEQLLDEEKTYSNDDFNASNISLDTNVDGENRKKLTEKNKLKISEKADKRILILLKNKGKKNPKADAQESESESENLKLTDKNYLEKKNFCQIYWLVVSLKQHIINYFSCIHCCKITKSFVPLSMRLIKSLFLLVLSFVFNILFLSQTYYENKFNHFNEKYSLVHAESLDLNVPTGERIGYAFSNTFVSAMISFILLIIVNFLVGFIFFSVRSDVEEMKTYSDMENLVSKVKTKNNIFFIIIMVLMVVFLLALTAFCGAYGGGFIDYFIGGIISLIFLEIFPFLWSLIIALLLYIGIRNKNNCCSKVGQFFMF